MSGGPHCRTLTISALKSLPSYQDEIPDDIGDEEDSIGTSQPRSGNPVSNLVDDEDMPKSRTEYVREKHPDTIESITSLAITYYTQGRYNYAERLYKQVLNL